MQRYLLSTDTIAPADFEAYVAHQRQTFASPQGSCIAAWLPKFGTPNQMTLVQDITDLPDLPAVLPLPLGSRLLARARETVDVIRPFPAALGDRTLCELRTYRITPAFREEFLALKTAILPLRESYSPSYGVFAPVTGDTSRVMHLWGYASLEDRDAVRARLKGDARWGEYIGLILPMIVEMQSSLITPILPG